MFGTPPSLGKWNCAKELDLSREEILAKIVCWCRRMDVYRSLSQHHSTQYYISSAEYDILDNGVFGGIFSPKVSLSGPSTSNLATGRTGSLRYAGTRRGSVLGNDGKVYLDDTRQQYTGDRVRCWTSDIDLEIGRSLTKPQPLVNVTVPGSEKSHIYKINGTDYLTTATEGANTDGHQEVSHRSTVSPGSVGIQPA
ncbi:hypothetical protein BDV11DRAFT_170523 [Aspergillus similis]